MEGLLMYCVKRASEETEVEAAPDPKFVEFDDGAGRT